MSPHPKPVNGNHHELPALVTYEDLERRLAHLEPHARLVAYFSLPQWERAEADLELRQRIDAYRDDDLEDDWSTRCAA